jgi:hypothetical protein
VAEREAEGLEVEAVAGPEEEEAREVVEQAEERVEEDVAAGVRVEGPAAEGRVEQAEQAEGLVAEERVERVEGRAEARAAEEIRDLGTTMPIRRTTRRGPSFRSFRLPHPRISRFLLLWPTEPVASTFSIPTICSEAWSA